MVAQLQTRPQRVPDTGSRTTQEHLPPSVNGITGVGSKSQASDPDRIFLHMHPRIRTLNPGAHIWPFCLWNLTLAIHPGKFGASDQRPSERTTTQTDSVFNRPSHQAPPPEGCSRSPDTALATVPSQRWAALRGASASGEIHTAIPQAEHNELVCSRGRNCACALPRDRLRRILPGPRAASDSTSQKAYRQQAPASAPGGDRDVARLRR